MIDSLDQFVRNVEQCGLLPADELRAIDAELFGEQPRARTAQALADELVRRKQLTEFQARTLLSGQPDELVFGNYVVLSQIGRGGMGLVYAAEHRRMKRRVALKVLSARAMQSPDAVRRFRREVEAAARLSHPNIVAAYDADEARGVHFLVMEYVDGPTLARYVHDHGPLPVGQAVEATVQAARGLAHAHAAGVIHRDIKPGNLLLDPQGTVKVLDLGLARFDRPSSGGAAGTAGALTVSGSIMGTTDYMSPEQGIDTRRADHRADIYSLGCTLHYLLSGRPVYPRDTVMQRMLAHREEPIPSLLAVRPEVPAELDTVFRRMLAKLPEARYQSMTEVIAALEPLASPLTFASGPGTAAVVISPQNGQPAQADLTLSDPESSSKRETADLTGVLSSLAETVTDQRSPLKQAKQIGPRRVPTGKWSQARNGLMAAVTFLAVLALWLVTGTDPPPAPARVMIGPEDGWVELLPLVDLGRDRVAGNWNVSGETLSIERISAAGRSTGETGLIYLPCHPAGDYDFALEARSSSSHNGIEIRVPVKTSPVSLQLGAHPGLGSEAPGRTALRDARGTLLTDDSGAVRNLELQGGRSYRIEISVRHIATSVSIAVRLDDDEIFRWTGKASRLPPGERPGTAGRLGLATHGAAVEYRDLEVRMVTGHADVGNGARIGPVTILKTEADSFPEKETR